MVPEDSLERLEELPGALLGPLGALLGRSWGALGVFLERSAALWGRSGALLERSRQLLESVRAPPQRQRMILARFCSLRALIFDLLGSILRANFQATCERVVNSATTLGQVANLQLNKPPSPNL